MERTWTECYIFIMCCIHCTFVIFFVTQCVHCLWYVNNSLDITHFYCKFETVTAHPLWIVGEKTSIIHTHKHATNQTNQLVWFHCPELNNTESNYDQKIEFIASIWVVSIKLIDKETIIFQFDLFFFFCI